MLQLHEAAARLYGALAKLYYQVDVATRLSWYGLCRSVMVCRSPLHMARSSATAHVPPALHLGLVGPDPKALHVG